MTSVEKNRGRNNIFTCCFQPADINENSIKPRRSKDCPAGPRPVFAISVEGEDKMVLPKILTSLSKDKPFSSDIGGCGTEGTSRRSFSRMFKSVLLKNQLVKKFTSRKARQESSQSKSNIVSEKNKKASNGAKVNPSTPDKSPDAGSSPWTSPKNSFSGATSISTCSSHGANVAELKQEDKLTSTGKARQPNSQTIGFCVLLVSLVILVFWGKIIAILCTTMFLFLVRRRIRVDSPVSGVDLPVNVVDSEAHKKKVIMEGLLERNRRSVISTTS